MADFDRNRARLAVTSDELAELVRLAVGEDAPADASPGLREAGLVTDDAVHPVAAAMALVAADPARSVVVERFDGTTMAPLYVGWDRAGRVTMTEDGGDGVLAITATEMELLPALLLQAVRLHPRVPAGRGEPVTTTAAVVERALRAGDPDATHGEAPEAAPGDAHAPDVAVPDEGDDPRLAALVDAFDHAWRATGSWQAEDADGTMTVVDAGVHGLWLVETEGDVVQPTHEDWPELEVSLVPTTGEEVRARLGDVVTGRRAPRPTGPGATGQGSS